MPRVSLLIVGLALSASIACGSSAQPGFTAADVTAIKDLSQELAAAFNDKDVDRLVGLYAGNASFMPPNSSTLHGHDSIKGFFETLLAGGATDLSIEPLDVQGQGQLAYETGHYRLVNRPADGPETRDRGKYLIVLRKLMGGQWRYEYTMWSSDLPEPIS